MEGIQGDEVLYHLIDHLRMTEEGGFTSSFRCFRRFHGLLGRPLRFDLQLQRLQHHWPSGRPGDGERSRACGSMRNVVVLGSRPDAGTVREVRVVCYFVCVCATGYRLQPPTPRDGRGRGPASGIVFS